MRCCDEGKKWLVDFNARKTHVKMDGTVVEKKSSFIILGLTFFSKLDWGPYIISIAKTASKKIGALICSMKFISSEVALCLCKLPYVGILLSCLRWCSYLLLVVLHLLCH